MQYNWCSVLSQIMNANDIEEFRRVFSLNYENLADYGITTPPNTLKMEDKITTVKSIALHHVLLRSKAEIDQFIERLECLGTRDMLKMYPQILFTYYMVGGHSILTAGKA